MRFRSSEVEVNIGVRKMDVIYEGKFFNRIVGSFLPGCEGGDYNAGRDSEQSARI